MVYTHDPKLYNNSKATQSPGKFWRGASTSGRMTNLSLKNALNERTEKCLNEGASFIPASRASVSISRATLPSDGFATMVGSSNLGPPKQFWFLGHGRCCADLAAS